jgi:hypothetical protein
MQTRGGDGDSEIKNNYQKSNQGNPCSMWSKIRTGSGCEKRYVLTERAEPAELQPTRAGFALVEEDPGCSPQMACPISWTARQH